MMNEPPAQDDTPSGAIDDRQLLVDQVAYYRARAAEYVKGTARLSPALQRELAAVLTKAVRELS